MPNRVPHCCSARRADPPRRLPTYESPCPVTRDWSGPGLLLPAVELALETADVGAAVLLTAELEETANYYGTPGLIARAAQARALLALAGGRPADAVAPLQQAAEIYRDQRYRYASAVVHEQLARAHRALGRAEIAEAEEATAKAIYERLGARPDLERLAPRVLPGGLTAREAEVLARVTAGASNRDVAQALVISDKTVGRHLANIYRKTGVSSRTAAASWARDHGIAFDPGTPNPGGWWADCIICTITARADLQHLHDAASPPGFLMFRS